MPFNIILLVSFIFYFTACDSDNSDSASETAQQSCAFFEDTNSCWRQSVAAAEACLWGTSVNGTLAGDGSTCTNGSTTITFTNNVNTAEPVATEPWDFSVNNGTDCMSFTETEGGSVLVTSLGTMTSSSSGFAISYTCPDGSTTIVDSVWAIDNCEFNTFPGFSTASGGAPSFSFSLTGAPESSDASFACM